MSIKATIAVAATLMIVSVIAFLSKYETSFPQGGVVQFAGPAEKVDPKLVREAEANSPACQNKSAKDSGGPWYTEEELEAAERCIEEKMAYIRKNAVTE